MHKHQPPEWQFMDQQRYPHLMVTDLLLRRSLEAHPLHLLHARQRSRSRCQFWACFRYLRVKDLRAPSDSLRAHSPRQLAIRKRSAYSPPESLSRRLAILSRRLHGKTQPNSSKK